MNDFNEDIGGWDILIVTNMECKLRLALSFKTDISSRKV